MSLREDGALAVDTPVGGFADAAPTAYQVVDGREVPVDVRYDLDPDAGTYGFALGGYDPSRRPLVIDPEVLVYVAYFGGHSSDNAEAVAVDDLGNVYVAAGRSAPTTRSRWAR